MMAVNDQSGIGSWACFLAGIAQQTGDKLCDLSLAVIQINYDAVSQVLVFFSWLLTTVCSTVSNVASVLWNLVAMVADLILECYNFVCCVLALCQKLCIIVVSAFDVLLRCLVKIVSILMNGGGLIWSYLAEACQDLNSRLWLSLTNASNFCWNAAQTISGAIGLIGSLTLNVFHTAFGVMYSCVVNVLSAIDSMFLGIADGMKYVLDRVYYFLVVRFTHMRRETLYGIMVIAIIYLFLLNIIRILSCRYGLTFPFSLPRHRHHRARRRANVDDVIEFSDQEDFIFHPFEDDGSVVTSVEDEDLSSENDDDDDDNSFDDENDIDDGEYTLDEDEDEEYEVDSSSDTEEVASNFSDNRSTTNSIDVQLPDSSRHYNLRRSATPKRQDMQSPKDYEDEIEREREKQKCVICQDRNKSVLILPCKHMCLCIDCGHKLARTRNVARRVCPLCRQKIQTIMNVYV